MNNATEVQLEELTAHQLYCISVVRTTISLIYVNGNKNGISVNGKILTPLPKTETETKKLRKTETRSKHLKRKLINLAISVSFPL